MRYKNLFLLMAVMFICILSSNGQGDRTLSDGAKKDAIVEFEEVRETNDTTTEARVIKKIFSLPEVKAKDKFIDSLSNHKRSISVIIMAKPNKKDKYYWVQAGDNNELRFEPFFNFYVMQHNLTVLFFDPLKNVTLTLTQWRKGNKNR